MARVWHNTSILDCQTIPLSLKQDKATEQNKNKKKTQFI
jgi:hypothetical protein